MFNVAQTNLQESRLELYKKLEAAAGVNRPLNQGDDFSFPAMDKMIKENGWICPIKPVYGDNAYYSIFNQHIDAMQLKIDQEQSQEAESRSKRKPQRCITLQWRISRLPMQQTVLTSSKMMETTMHSSLRQRNYQWLSSFLYYFEDYSYLWVIAMIKASK